MIVDVLICVFLVAWLLGIIEAAVAILRGRIVPTGPVYVVGIILLAWTIPLRRLNVLSWFVWHRYVKRDLYIWKRDKPVGGKMGGGEDPCEDSRRPSSSS